MNPIKVLAT